MNHDQRDQLALGESLSIREMRSAEFVPEPLDEREIARNSVRAEQLLRRLQLIEDTRSLDDKKDEHGAAEQTLLRLEARLELLTALVSRVMERRGESREIEIRWSSEGAVLPAGNAAPGTLGWLRIQPADWMPDSIALPAKVIASDATHTWLRFECMPATQHSALEQHLFRMHRREIAEQRRARLHDEDAHD